MSARDHERCPVLLSCVSTDAILCGIQHEYDEKTSNIRVSSDVPGADLFCLDDAALTSVRWTVGEVTVSIRTNIDLNPRFLSPLGGAAGNGPVNGGAPLPAAVSRALAAVVSRSSLRQGVKGLLTAGVLKSATYAVPKVAQAIAGRRNRRHYTSVHGED